MELVCTSMKANGIIIYGITFGNSVDTPTRALYSRCATKPEFYSHATNNAALRTVFRQVGMQLSNLRIAQ